jgi:UDP-N-acetylglucosamine transferase subunit ALG13
MLIDNYKTCILFGNLRTKFLRLSEYINFNINVLPTPIFIQAGHNIDSFNTHINCDILTFVSNERLENIIKYSDLIITHGGYGSIKLAFKNFKRPIVIPRLKVHHEHIDDHQYELVEYYKSLNLIDEVNNLSDFNNIINKKNFNNYLHKETINKLYDNNNLKNNLITDIINYLK